MRRYLAATVLLSVMITPVLHQWCEASCAEEATTPVPVSCHHHFDGAAAPVIAEQDDCGSRDMAPAILARVSTIGAPLMVAVAADLRPAPRDASPRVPVAAARPPDTSPPAFISPLRL
jgi:hypothetical protein